MTVSLTYGAPTSHSSLIAHFAIARGLFRREGIEAAVKVVHGGPELASAYHSGAIPMGEMGSPPAITGIGGGRRIKIVGSSMRRGVALFFVTRADLPAIGDLRGGRMGALSAGSCSDWYLREVLRQNGLEPGRDVEIVGLGADHDRVNELIGEGSISGALVSGLNAKQGERDGVSRCWGSAFDVATVPDLQWSVHVANQDFLDRETDLAATVLETLRKAGEMAERDPQEWIAFTAEKFDLDRDLSREVFEIEKPFLHFQGRLDLEGLQRSIDLQNKLGALKRELTLDDVVDWRFQTPQPGPMA